MLIFVTEYFHIIPVMSRICDKDYHKELTLTSICENKLSQILGYARICESEASYD